jgi:hypothetical protein
MTLEEKITVFRNNIYDQSSKTDSLSLLSYISTSGKKYRDMPVPIRVMEFTAEEGDAIKKMGLDSSKLLQLSQAKNFDCIVLNQDVLN